MKEIVRLILVGVVSACCSGWLRTAQTAKNLGFIEYGAMGDPIERVVVWAPSATTVSALQIDMDIQLHRDITTIDPTCECPLKDCYACRYYFDMFLVVNTGQGVGVPVIQQPEDLFDQVFPISLPRNDSNLLYGHVGSLQCIFDKVHVSYNTATDASFTARWPDGIQLNQGDTIEFHVTSVAQGDECFPIDGVVGIDATGIANYILSYGDKE